MEAATLGGGKVARSKTLHATREAQAREARCWAAACDWYEGRREVIEVAVGTRIARLGIDDSLVAAEA
jgi:hypothetical protein